MNMIAIDVRRLAIACVGLLSGSLAALLAL